MGHARELVERLNQAVFKQDHDTIAELLAPDAVTVTPDAGELVGIEATLPYMRKWLEAFPDADYEYLYRHETEDTAINEGVFRGTQTGPLAMPDGSVRPPTGLPLTLRACDFCTVADGRIVSHRLYFDNDQFRRQLGIPEPD